MSETTIEPLEPLSPKRQIFLSSLHFGSAPPEFDVRRSKFEVRRSFPSVSSRCVPVAQPGWGAPKKLPDSFARTTCNGRALRRGSLRGRQPSSRRIVRGLSGRQRNEIPIRNMALKITGASRVPRVQAPGHQRLASHRESWSSAPLLSFMRWDSPPSSSPRSGSLPFPTPRV